MVKSTVELTRKLMAKKNPKPEFCQYFDFPSLDPLVKQMASGSTYALRVSKSEAQGRLKRLLKGARKRLVIKDYKTVTVGRRIINNSI